MTPTGRRLHELGAFLRVRRGSIAPTVPGARRTPGLRRSEVAATAGVSLGYYVRLEQGRGGPPSPSVLDALARALHLDDDERAHLHLLADGPPDRHPPAITEGLLGQARDVLALVRPAAAAYVIDRLGDVLAWNPLAAALFVDHFGPVAGARPNNARYVFAHPAARRLFVRWDDVADDAVAHLRATAGHRVDDPELGALVTELTHATPEFAPRWSRRPVRPMQAGRKLLDHPRAGRLDLAFRVLEIAGTCHHRLVVHSADTASAAERSLEELTSAAPRPDDDLL
jgi:transcriptional regulator with XRE-family HTH domain